MLTQTLDMDLANCCQKSLVLESCNTKTGATPDAKLAGNKLKKVAIKTSQKMKFK